METNVEQHKSELIHFVLLDLLLVAHAPRLQHNEAHQPQRNADKICWLDKSKGATRSLDRCELHRRQQHNVDLHFSNFFLKLCVVCLTPQTKGRIQPQPQRPSTDWIRMCNSHRHNHTMPNRFIHHSYSRFKRTNHKHFLLQLFHHKLCLWLLSIWLSRRGSTPLHFRFLSHF